MKNGKVHVVESVQWRWGRLNTDDAGGRRRKRGKRVLKRKKRVSEAMKSWVTRDTPTPSELMNFNIELMNRFIYFTSKFLKAIFMCSPSWMGEGKEGRNDDSIFVLLADWLCRWHYTWTLGVEKGERSQDAMKNCESSEWSQQVESWRRWVMKFYAPPPLPPSPQSFIWRKFVNFHNKIKLKSHPINDAIFAAIFSPRLNATQAFPFFNHQWVQTQKISIYFQPSPIAAAAL